MQLNPNEIIETIGRLEKRIGERFPGSGLSSLAGDLRITAGDVLRRADSLQRPNLLLRASTAFLLLMIAAVVVYIATQLRFVDAAAWEVLEGLEAAISSLVFLGAAVLFLVTAENRIIRNRILVAIEELRELAHIIDMHQLTKDPEGVGGTRLPTKSSPGRVLDPFLLGRYLDYCSEMLSLIGKIAAIYAHGSHDSSVLAAIDNVDDLTTRLSLKIWQKIMILDAGG